MAKVNMDITAVYVYCSDTATQVNQLRQMVGNSAFITWSR